MRPEVDFIKDYGKQLKSVLEETRLSKSLKALLSAPSDFLPDPAKKAVQARPQRKIMGCWRSAEPTANTPNLYLEKAALEEILLGAALLLRESEK